MTKENITDVVRKIAPLIDLTDLQAKEIAQTALNEWSAKQDNRPNNHDQRGYFIALSINRQKRAIAATMQKVHN